jgi:class 3 adenylate cyclase
MREAMKELNARHDGHDILLKIGLHAGPYLAVALNDRQDYFGQTVNIAARVQGLAEAEAVTVTDSIVKDHEAKALIDSAGLGIAHSRRTLRGIDEETSIYEIV